MAAPKTLLLVAPTKVDKSMGRCIMSSDLVRGLKELNSAISAWEQYQEGLWWPGKDTGLSCLWLGEPGGKSRKITAFKNGAVPEWSQENPDGTLFCKGWRAIFQKVMRIKAASQRQIEGKFNVLLDLDKDYDPEYCRLCRKMGKWVKTDGGVDKLCRMHVGIKHRVKQFYQAKLEETNERSSKLSH